LTLFFVAAFAGQGFLQSLLARLQVKGVTLHCFNDVFLLHLTLKSTKSVFQRLGFLEIKPRPTKLHPQTRPY
jgi:hypothetical protein